MHRPRAWQLALLAVFLWGGEMVRRDLWEPDEARYAYVAREMRQGGHWLVPHRSGGYYAHKPPLLFWLINLGSWATRLPIGPVPSRLPGFLAGVLILWMTARLAERWRGPVAAWPSVLVLCTNYMVWHEIGFGRIDGLLLGLTTAAIYLLVRNDDGPGAWRPALAYAFMGLAILAKGPVGFFIPAGAYAAMRWAAGEGRMLKKGHWAWGPLITLAFPAAWLGLAWWRGAPDGYFHELLYRQNVERAAGELGHEKPWHYFLTTVPADFLPWTFLLPAAYLALRRDPDAAVFRRRLLGWALFVILLFSLSHSKRNIYVLGAFPALAILVGGAWDAMARAPGRWVRGGLGLFTAFLLVGGVGAFAVGFFPRLPIPAWVLWPAGAAALAGGLWMLREWRRRGIGARLFHGAAVAMFAVQWGVGTWVYPAINPLKAPLAFAREAQAKVPPGRPLLLYSIDGEILSFYADRPGRVYEDVPSIEAAMREEARGLAVFEEDDWASVRDLLTVSGDAHPFRMGGKRLVRFDYDTGAPGSSDQDRRPTGHE